MLQSSPHLVTSLMYLRILSYKNTSMVQHLIIYAILLYCARQALF